jgi:hypothetical protein
LALGQVETTFGDRGRKVVEDVGVLGRGTFDRRSSAGGGSCGGDEVHSFETVTEFAVGVVVEGVEVGADGTREEDGVLGNDGQSRPEIVKLNLGNVQTIDMNTT